MGKVWVQNLVMKGLAGEPSRDVSQEELDRIWLLYGDQLGGGGCQRQESGQIGLSSDLLLYRSLSQPSISHPHSHQTLACSTILLPLTWLHFKEPWFGAPTLSFSKCPSGVWGLGSAVQAGHSTVGPVQVTPFRAVAGC